MKVKAYVVRAPVIGPEILNQCISLTFELQASFNW